MPKSAPQLAIWPGMDVYSAYQDQYIGIVVAVWARPITQSKSPDERRVGRTDSTGQAAGRTAHLVQEEGDRASPLKHARSQQSGEEMGPFPTIEVGNAGPINQSASHDYAIVPLEDEGIVWFAVRPGRWNPFARALCLPTSAVRSVSMERIVVDL